MLFCISKLVRQLYRKNKPLAVAVFLVIICLISGAVFLKKTGLVEERGVLGGPVPSLVSSAEGAGLTSPAALVSSVDIASVGVPVGIMGVDPMSSDRATIKDIGSPVGPTFNRSGTTLYTIQQGDNLSKIASYFGVSIDTIMSANRGAKNNALKAGQTIKILPTSGVLYQAQSGDTLKSISSLFGISEDKITQFNRSVNFALQIGRAHV